MRTVAIIAVLGGCHYHAGTFAAFQGPFQGIGLTVGCVDVALAVAHDPDTRNAPVIQYSFGNRCEHRVTLDLATVRVVARHDDGSEVTLHPYDPRAEIEPRLLDALLWGSERIEYSDPTGETALSICADVGRIDPEMGHADRWVCVGRTEIR